jgi:hypothetical protein
MIAPAAIAAAALALRASHPHAPTLDVLDLAMEGHHGVVDFGADAMPPAAFGLLVAKALDGGMCPEFWACLMAPGGHAAVQATLRDIWRDEVWPLFLARYGPTA